MYDFRFQIVTLTAVFLALGLGIIIGISLIDDQILLKEQSYLIDRLEADFDHLRERNNLSKLEIAEYKNTIKMWEEFSEIIFPFSINGILKGKRFLLIETGGNKFPESLTENIKRAGGEILAQINADALTKANGLEGDGIQIQSFVDEINKFVSQTTFVESGILKEREETNLRRRIDGVILLGGTEEEEKYLVETLDLPLISHLQSYDIIVAGTELGGTTLSYIPHYLKRADIIIEQVETIPSQVALIWSLTGVPGYYGVGAKAASLLPMPFLDIE